MGAPGTSQVEPWEPLLAKVGTIAESGAQSLGLAALEDGDPPCYSRAVAEEVVAAGMPMAALSPLADPLSLPAPARPWPARRSFSPPCWR